MKKVFLNQHVILPVIHVANKDQALRNTKIARDAGADGVFLINHSISVDELLTIHQSVVAEHNWWIGVNCLGWSAKDALSKIDDTVNGIWIDNADDSQEAIEDKKKTGWAGLYFGGVAFKYQPPVKSYAEAATAAMPFVDVVTTSGEGTGQAAPLEKIRTMKEALGEHPLAIASGITPENVADYLDIADCFLVATGISESFHELDPVKTKLLIETVRR